MSRYSFIPLTFALFLFPSIQFVVILFDGPHTEYYGFPLPWNSRFIAGSMVKVVYVIPLLIDIIFYGLVSYLLWRYIIKRIATWKPLYKNVTTGFIWIYGLSALYLIVLVLSIGSFYHGWYDDEFDIIKFNLSLCI